MELGQRPVPGVWIRKQHGSRQMLRQRVGILDRDHLIEDAVHDETRLRDSAELREALPAIAALPRTKRRELRGRDVRTRQGLAILLGSQKRSEERREGKSVEHGGGRVCEETRRM